MKSTLTRDAVVTEEDRLNAILDLPAFNDKGFAERAARLQALCTELEEQLDSGDEPTPVLARARIYWLLDYLGPQDVELLKGIYHREWALESELAKHYASSETNLKVVLGVMASYGLVTRTQTAAGHLYGATELARLIIQART